MTPPETKTGDARRPHCRIALPRGFRRHDFLAFHARDPAAVAERVDADRLCKGLIWQGSPAVLQVRFEAGEALAELRADALPASRPRARAGVTGKAAMAGGRDGLRRLMRHMLGLNQGIEEFEERFLPHPVLGPLIAGNRGLRVPLAASPFEALCWAIIGQQISVNAAVSIRRRLIVAAGLRHSSGLWCFPEPAAITRLGDAGLRETGFSRSKAATLLALCEGVSSASLSFDDWLEAPPVEDIRERLLAIRGIGPWTVSYALLRGFGALDGSLHGDVAVRRSLQVLLGRTEKPTIEEARVWLAGFSPWRALIAAHLWALQSASGY